MLVTYLYCVQKKTSYNKNVKSRHVIHNELQRWPTNFVEKYYFWAELLIVEYWRQIISVTNTALHTAVVWSEVTFVDAIKIK